MAAFIFIGNGKSDPLSLKVYGYEFALNGAAVSVDDVTAGKLSGNSHFAASGADLTVTNSALPSDKNELEKLARDLFGVELDKRKTVANLQKQVQELINDGQDSN